jgi:sortase A
VSATLLVQQPQTEVARRQGAHRAPIRGTARGPHTVTSLRPELSAGVAVTKAVLTLFSLLTLWLVLYAVVFSGLQEERAQHGLYAALRAQLAAETAPAGGPIKAGKPVALLDAPAIGIHDAVVVEGTSSATLQKGPGHLANTVLPGQAGVSAILGKSVTFGGPFASIPKLHMGNPITLTTVQGVAQYVVTDVRRGGDPLPAPLSAGQGRLTLVAVVGPGWRSGWAPTGLVYVDANLQGSGQTAPPGRPMQVPSAQQAMGSSSGALYSLALWLEATAIVAVAVTWVRSRWGGWQVWLAGAPLVLATVWIVTETSTRLLPNLL